MHVERKIWPVGQGAFYTESFNDGENEFNIIYDCGSYGKKRSAKCPNELLCRIHEFICHPLFPKKQINLLFISHFHTDHINGIKYLLDECTKFGVVKPTLVMPLLDEKTKLIYFIENILDFRNENNGSQENNEDTDGLISFYHSLYFGRIVEDVIEITDSENRDSGYKSGVVLPCDKTTGLPKDMHWVFIPILCVDKNLSGFVKECVTRINAIDSKILDNLKKGNFTPLTESVWNDIDKAISEVKKSNNANLNNMSLMLYSGREGKTNNRTSIPCCNCLSGVEYHNCFGAIRKKGYYNPGALYTGDMEIKDAWVTIKDKLLKQHPFTRDLNLFQISHHGHNNDFNKEMIEQLSPKYVFCCYGSENTYKHPDFRLLRSYWENEIHVDAISEEDRKFEQYIKY